MGYSKSFVLKMLLGSDGVLLLCSHPYARAVPAPCGCHTHLPGGESRFILYLGIFSIITQYFGKISAQLRIRQ
jgi:hypothetical protein